MPNQSDYWALTDFSGAINGGAKLFVIADDVELPVSRLSLSHGLNAIPSATALIALGRDARTNEYSPIYKVAKDLQQMVKVRIEIRGTMGEWSPRGGKRGGKSAWPGGTHILFVGYVSGMSYRRSLGRVSLVLNMTNQLVDLAMSSGGSKDVVPGAPHDLMLPTLSEGPGGKDVGTAASKFVEELPTDLNVDFSMGVLKSLHWLSQNNQIQTHDGGSTDNPWCHGDSGIASERASNEKASRVIEGFEDWNGIEGYSSDEEDGTSARSSGYAKPYPLEIHSTGQDHTAQCIGNVIASSIAGSSMWEMLIGALIPEFGVFIIPLAQSAIMAPIIPTNRTAYKVIKSSDYADFNLKAMSQRPLYGVGVMGSYQTATIVKTSSDNKQCVGASYVAKADDGTEFVDGMWMFVEAPRWMDDWINHDPAPADGEDTSVSKMLNGTSHDATGVDDEAVDREPDDEVEEWNDVMEKYARMMYASNSLKGRQGTVVGKLRFDICPGMTVMLDADRELKSPGVDQFPTSLFGLVARITITIDAEQASANTAIELTHLRTDVENEQDRFSMETHPFFDQNFFEGAPLVESLDVE